MVNVKCLQSPKHLLYIKQKTTFEAANKPLEPAGNTAFSTRWPPLLPHQQNNQSYVTFQIWLIPTRKSVSSLSFRARARIILSKQGNKLEKYVHKSVLKTLDKFKYFLSRHLQFFHFFSCRVATLHIPKVERKTIQNISFYCFFLSFSSLRFYVRWCAILLFSQYSAKT